MRSSSVEVAAAQSRTVKFGIDAAAVAQRSSEQVPVGAVFLHPLLQQPDTVRMPFWNSMRGAGRQIGSGVRRLFRWSLRPGAEPNRVVAFYSDRAELLAWPVGSPPPGTVQVLCHRAEGRKIYIGSNQLRIAGKQWIMSPTDRDELLGALRDSVWSSHVSEIS